MEKAIEENELQWAATLLNHITFTGSKSDQARLLLTEVYRHMGYRSESGIMRNIYLSGAQELQDGVRPIPMAGGRNDDLAATLDLKDWFDAFAVRLNPERSRGQNLVLNFEVDNRTACVMVDRQTEFARVNYQSKGAHANITIDQQTLEAVAAGTLTLEEAQQEERLTITGDKALVQHWLQMHDDFDLWFNIVTP